MWHDPFQLLLTEFYGHWASFWLLWALFIVVLWIADRGDDGWPRAGGEGEKIKV